MKYQESGKWLAAAKPLIPSAAQTYSKSYKYFCEGVAPAFLSHGKDGHVWDVDGNEFIDFVCGLGAVLLGYNNKEVNKAVTDQLAKGISFSQPTILEVQLAQKLVEVIPCAEMVKFVKNGSDATTAAIRLARAFTKREIVATSGYHGFHEWFIGTTENDAGVPVGVKQLTKTFKYNDIASITKLLEENIDSVAAVILEPCQGTGPKDGYLEELKKLVHKHGAILIFDEVVSGFRMGLGGAQATFGVTPDLATFGKGLGNGLAISAVVGRADILKLIDAGAFVSTTSGGEALSLAGALATIEVLEKPGTLKHIHGLGSLWLEEVSKLIEEKGLGDNINMYGLTPHCGITFNDCDPLTSWDLLSVYQQTLLEHGILSIGVNNFCLAHTEEDVKIFISAVDKALDSVSQALKEGTTENILKGEKIRPIFTRR